MFVQKEASSKQATNHHERGNEEPLEPLAEIRMFWVGLNIHDLGSLGIALRSMTLELSGLPLPFIVGYEIEPSMMSVAMQELKSQQAWGPGCCTVTYPGRDRSRVKRQEKR